MEALWVTKCLNRKPKKIFSVNSLCLPGRVPTLPKWLWIRTLFSPKTLIWSCSPSSSHLSLSRITSLASWANPALTTLPFRKRTASPLPLWISFKPTLPRTLQVLSAPSATALASKSHLASNANRLLINSLLLLLCITGLWQHRPHIPTMAMATDRIPINSISNSSSNSSNQAWWRSRICHWSRTHSWRASMGMMWRRCARIMRN